MRRNQKIFESMINSKTNGRDFKLVKQILLNIKLLMWKSHMMKYKKQLLDSVSITEKQTVYLNAVSMTEK